jgi:hypothetical protein
MLRQPAIPVFNPATRSDGAGRYAASQPSQVASLPFANFTRPSASLPPAASLTALMMTIERLELAIDQETQELRLHKVADLREFNNRKSQGLLELSRAMRGLGEAARDRRLQAKLAQLRAKLAENLSVLSMHLTAAQEVSQIISRAIQDAESDGTYSASPRADGRQAC